MEKIITAVFWFGVFMIVYTYIGYPIIIFCLAAFKRLRQKRFSRPIDQDLPEVTIIIAAYNEVDFIEQKIKNTFELDYPSEKKKIYVVTDGSDDGTPEIVKKFPSVVLFHEPERKGKIHATNRVIPAVVTPIVVFSDANTFVNGMALKKMVRHYVDPMVGGVAGEKRIVTRKKDNSSGSGEGLYWRYESFIKKSDSDFNSIVGAAGELFSMRTELFEPPSAEIIIEDFYVSMQVVAKGFKFIYEPEAYALETASASIDEEWKRKVRIAAGGVQAILKMPLLLNPLRFGALSFQYFSHRVLRWTLAPFSLLLVFISGFILAESGPSVYKDLFILQLLFYVAALTGYRLKEMKLSGKIFFVPLYFVMMNFAVFAGALRFFRGKQSAIWEKTQRALDVN